MKKAAIVYTSAFCPVCDITKSLLTSLDIPFKEVNVDMNPIARGKLIAKTRRLTVPQTNINGKWIFGFHPEKIMKAWND